MRSCSARTGVSGSRGTVPFRRTRPARIKFAACAREQYPIFERARAKPMHRVDCSRFIGLMLTEVRETAKSVRSPPTLGRMFIAPNWQEGALMAHQHPPRFLKIVDDAKKR